MWYIWTVNDRSCCVSVMFVHMYNNYGLLYLIVLVIRFSRNWFCGELVHEECRRRLWSLWLSTA